MWERDERYKEGVVKSGVIVRLVEVKKNVDKVEEGEDGSEES